MPRQRAEWHHRPPESGGDLTKCHHPRSRKVHQAATWFGVRDREHQQPQRIVEVNDLHRAIGETVGKHRQREQPAHPIVDAAADDERRADHHRIDVGRRHHLFDAGLLDAVRRPRSHRVLLAVGALPRPVDVRRRRENDSTATVSGHGVEDVAGAPDVDLLADANARSRVFHPGAVCDGVGAGHATSHGIRVPDVTRDEINRERPTFGAGAVQSDDVVTRAAQSGSQPAAEHTAGTGDRDSHRLASVMCRR